MPNNRFGWTKVLAQAPGSARVLVVDDEVQVRQSLTRLVTHFGYEVKTAASAEEADHWLSSQRFHVVLLDIELPRMKGVEFLSWALEKDPEQAVIMLTGLDDPDLAIECIDKGARRPGSPTPPPGTAPAGSGGPLLHALHPPGTILQQAMPADPPKWSEIT